jgi:leucyl aminopeptidase
MQIRFSDAVPHIIPLVIAVKSKNIDFAALAAVIGVSEALLAQACTANRFDGEAGALVELFAPLADGARRIFLLGLGNGEGDSASKAEKAGGALVARLLSSGETKLALNLAACASPSEAGALLLGAELRSWRLDVYRTKLPEKQKASLVELLVVAAPDGSAAAWAAQETTARGVALARELVTEPANIIYPESFVARVTAALEPLGVTISVLDEPAMRALGMGALLGVAQGSVRPPRLLALSWLGGIDGAPPVALVGKGVTFDTGGISIKPAAGMEDMKWDMGGAAAVAGALYALAARKAKANVIGICGLVENMPDGNAQRPGDVVTSMSGQTIEVINTDAEGRLVLCDALTWVQQTYRPQVIVDLATLTGAMIVSLGHEYGGLFANDDGLAGQLTAAGRAVGEPLWRMPLGEAYDKMIDSPIADIKNVGPREAGSITAAQFIQRFINDGVRWAHLDIAGMVWAAKPGATYDKGATGYGVRLLDRFVADNFAG